MVQARSYVAKGMPAAMEADFERTYRAFAPLVRAIAFRILRNQSDADDAVQTVLLHIWSSPERFRGGNFEGWITVLAKHAALDILRSGRRERARLESLCAAFEPPNVETLALARLSADTLWRTVDALPATQRRAVLASYYVGQSHTRIARSTRTPVGTVKSRIRAGVLRLRQRIVPRTQAAEQLAAAPRGAQPSANGVRLG